LIKRAEDAQQVYFTTRAEQVADEPLVQTIDEVVNRLDMTPLYACWSEKGRAFYDPSMMLKVLFFAYSEGERHSRDIAKRIKYDVRYQYFTGSHRPSYVTICRFRTIDVELLAKYFVEIVSICAELGLLDTTVLAIDGTKIKASASRRRTLLQKDWDRLTARYKALLSSDAASDRADIGSEAHDDHRDDSDESQVKEVDRKSLNVRIVEAMKRLGSGEREVNLTDGDARFMKTSEGSIRPCYNGQIAVDKNQFIVAADLVNSVDDKGSLELMIEQSQRNVTPELGSVLVDGGYNSGRNLKYIRQSGLDVYMPMGSGYPEPADKFGRDAFVYDASEDRYRCPAGEYLHYKHRRRRNGVEIKLYRCSSKICGRCSLLSQCTTSKCKRRELCISEVYDYEVAMKEKLNSETGRKIYARRKVMVEPVFGNMKFNLGFSRFLVRGLKKAKREFLLMCIAHNLKKMSRRWVRLTSSVTLTTALQGRISAFLSLFLEKFNIIATWLKKSNQKTRICLLIPKTDL